MFSSAGSQPISLKSFQGLGHFPNKIARVYKHEHCLPSAFCNWQVMRSGYRRALLAGMAALFLSIPQRKKRLLPRFPVWLCCRSDWCCSIFSSCVILSRSIILNYYKRKYAGSFQKVVKTESDVKRHMGIDGGELYTVSLKTLKNGGTKPPFFYRYRFCKEACMLFCNFVWMHKNASKKLCTDTVSLCKIETDHRILCAFKIRIF